jgi:hypothetical protein
MSLGTSSDVSSARLRISQARTSHRYAQPPVILAFDWDLPRTVVVRR